MYQENDSDAAILWDDVLALLEDRGLPAATLAMFRSCQALSLDDEALHIGTSMGFAQRRIAQQSDIIEEALAEAAFEPLAVVVELVKGGAPKPIETGSTVTPAELGAMDSSISGGRMPAPQPEVAPETPAEPLSPEGRRRSNPLFEEVPEGGSKLTFDRFVAGEENMLALDAAKQVANGENKSYNPLFIYGKSGLGKTHLLRAIQNYITSNDPSRLCIYRTAGDFVDEYVSAMRDEKASLPRQALTRHYQDVDVLIIDDIQNMSTALGSIHFFFETFNYLTSHGKQVVLAADRAPSQLGMGDSLFDERDTSRMDSGVTVSIQVPDYELKLNLVNAFYERMKADAEAEHIVGMEGTINEESRKLMAERSGTNIRIIEGFVQSCLMLATQRERQGTAISREDILRTAAQKWPTGQRIITIEQIQKAVETYYDISHTALIGSKRNKELMEPRHVAIWLTRELTDNTLADIGKKFGGRSHATVKHSIAWVDDLKKQNRVFHDRLDMLHDNITDAAQ